MKKITYMFFCFWLIFVFFLTSCGEDDYNLRFNTYQVIFSSDVGGVLVSGIVDKDVKEVTIPSEHNGYQVIGIGHDAFKGCINLEKVTMPDSILFIEEGAFSGCCSLREVRMSKNIQYVYHEAFYYCFNLDLNQKDNGLYLGNEENPYICFMRMNNKEMETCFITEKCKCVYKTAFVDYSLSYYYKNLKSVYFNLDIDEYKNLSTFGFPFHHCYFFTNNENEEREGKFWYYDSNGEIIEIIN